jgi:hypothetical protein
MEITHTWEIVNKVFDTNIVHFENMLVFVEWKKIGTDEYGNKGEFLSGTGFDTASITQLENYKKAEDITDEMIIEWVKEKVNKHEYYVESINQEIEKQILEKRNKA